MGNFEPNLNLNNILWDLFHRYPIALGYIFQIYCMIEKLKVSHKFTVVPVYKARLK